MNRRRWLLTLTVVTLSWQALHMLAAPLLARTLAAQHDDPAAFTEICSTLGIKRLPLASVAGTDDSAPSPGPAGPASHDADHDDCPWCRLTEPDQITAPIAPAPLAAPACSISLAAPATDFFPIPVHRPDLARGPPASR